MMTTKEKEALQARIDESEHELKSKVQALATLRKQYPAEEVKDYELKCGQTGKDITLSQLIGFFDNKELILIHNMGSQCPGCTAWADGFSGVWEHLNDRVGFVVASTQPPEVQQKVKAARGWKFPMVSAYESDFTKDMGFTGEDQGYGENQPGISVFKKTGDGRILRTNKAVICPEDLFTPIFHLLDLTQQGREGWFPKLKY